MTPFRPPLNLTHVNEFLSGFAAKWVKNTDWIPSSYFKKRLSGVLERIQVHCFQIWFCYCVTKFKYSMWNNPAFNSLRYVLQTLWEAADPVIPLNECTWFSKSFLSHLQIACSHSRDGVQTQFRLGLFIPFLNYIYADLWSVNNM